MQPEKCHRQLSQIASAWANGKPPRATEGIRNLSFQRRQIPLPGSVNRAWQDPQQSGQRPLQVGRPAFHVPQQRARKSQNRLLFARPDRGLGSEDGILPDEAFEATHFTVICLIDHS